MLEDGLLALNQPNFADIIEQRRIIQDEVDCTERHSAQRAVKPAHR